MMNWKLFWDILSIDSTSGRERTLSDWLLEHLEAPSKQAFDVGDGTQNLLLSWGTPRVVFCTHMDTVPPYIPPVTQWDTLASLGMTKDKAVIPAWDTLASLGMTKDKAVIPTERSEGENLIMGRGSCDAKGQIFALYTACKELEASGFTDFGLLLLSGEETGSWGAKAFARTDFRAPYLIVGEPTENRMVSAAKGTLSYDLRFTGQAFHSGYPQYGVSAVDLFNQFYNRLKTKDFGTDSLLGDTTWNVGLLHSDNPQNILSPELTCRLYFRTTFVSHQAVQDWMREMAGQAGHDGNGTAGHDRNGQAGHDGTPGQETNPVTPGMTGRLAVTARGGDVPARYFTLEGFASAPVAFGSDAPHLSNFTHRAICGPGSIRHAHRPDEQISAEELETAVAQYVSMYKQIIR